MTRGWNRELDNDVLTIEAHVKIMILNAVGQCNISRVYSGIFEYHSSSVVKGC